MLCTTPLLQLFVWIWRTFLRNGFYHVKDLWSKSCQKLEHPKLFLIHTIGWFPVFVLVLTSVFNTTPCLVEPDYSNLREEIAASLRCRDSSGMVVAVVKDGKTIFSEAFGVLHPGSKLKVTLDTKFMILSLTKAFTAALLVDVFASNPRNKSYPLSTPLRDIMGKDFRFADEHRTKYASAEDLLSHRIGFSDFRFMRFNPNINRSHVISLARAWKSKLPFRSQARYSSTSYTLAAAITEYLGGKPWENLITERIFNPLGMTSTGFASTTDFSKDDIVKPYKSNSGDVDPIFTKTWNSRCGSGCLVSTVEDMTKWMNFFLSTGKNASGHQAMPVKQVETLTKARTYLPSTKLSVIGKPSFPETSTANQYSLGWRRGIYKGHSVISHPGSSPGFAAIIMMYPDENLGIFVAMNGEDLHYYYRLALVHYISDHMFGETSWLDKSTLCTFPSPWMTPFKHRVFSYETGHEPALPYIEYMGTYTTHLYGDLIVNFNYSTFSLHAHYGIGTWELVPQEERNNFFGKGLSAIYFWNVPGFRFQCADEDDQKITDISIDGFDPENPPVFKKKN